MWFLLHIRSLTAQASISSWAIFLATRITQPEPSFVGEALKTRQEVIATPKSRPSISATPRRHNEQGLTALVAIGFATLCPSRRASMRAQAIEKATAEAWAAAAWPIALQLIRLVCSRTTR
jgi:hypothetical protein